MIQDVASHRVPTNHRDRRSATRLLSKACIWEAHSPPPVQPRLPALSLHSQHPTDPSALLSQRVVDKQLREWQVPDMRHSHPEWNSGYIISLVKFGHPLSTVSLEQPIGSAGGAALSTLLSLPSPCLVRSAKTLPAQQVWTHTYTEAADSGPVGLGNNRVQVP